VGVNDKLEATTEEIDRGLL